MTEIEKVRALLEAMTAQHKSLGDDIASKLEEKGAVWDERGAMVVKLEGAQAEQMKVLTALQGSMNTLRAELADAELERDRSKPAAVAKGTPHLFEVVRKSDGFKAYQKKHNQPGVTGWNLQPDDETSKVPAYLWATKDALTIDSTNNPGIVPPYYRPEIILNAKPAPVFRSLFPVLQTGPTNSVKVDRELVEYPWTAQLTANAAATATTALLDYTLGLSTAAPYNSVTFTEGANSETVTISAINTATGQITFAPALANLYTAPVNGADGNPTGGAIVSAAYFQCTPESNRKPRALDLFEEKTVPVCTLGHFIKVSKQILDDDARLERVLNQRMLNRLARMEDKAFLYGAGGDQISGIFPDAAVPRYDWSGSEAGATKIDHMINVIYEIIKQNYTPTALVVSPDDHKDIAKTKGDDGHYVLVMDISQSAPPTLYGIALLWSNQLERLPGDAGGDFVVADFQTSGTIYDRMSDELQIGMDGNDMTRNKRTILAERRFAFCIELPLAMAKGTFDAAP